MTGTRPSLIAGMPSPEPQSLATRTRDEYTAAIALNHKSRWRENDEEGQGRVGYGRRS